LKAFLNAPRAQVLGPWTAVSLFSGDGLSDIGYEHAGFEFLVQVEKDPLRAALGQDNFPRSKWIIGDAHRRSGEIVAAYKRATERPLDLLVATPPCQGMSSSNPDRGKRKEDSHKKHERKNKLILEVIPLARKLLPRLVVVENVRPILTLRVRRKGREARAIDHIRRELQDYCVFEGVVDVADYGVPQVRRRAIVLAVRRDEPWLADLLRHGLLPWPRATHAERPEPGQRRWITIMQWLEEIGYERLDARSSESARGLHPLHFVPHYTRQPDRYIQVSQIPPHSGRSAYSNSTCPKCGAQAVPEGRVTCHKCGALMRNRPYVMGKKGPRLIKGFGRSSYRRMAADRPAPTVTTNTDRVGSDRKIHPCEHRVLSVLEVADLQTIPRSYDWSRALDERRTYLIRNAVGEAFPPYFTYLHGTLLARLLAGEGIHPMEFASTGPEISPSVLLDGAATNFCGSRLVHV
jgi:DNA (cytosine-5)-methyltransferase 1